MPTSRRAGGRTVTSVPPIRMRPELGISSPAIILRIVVLPQPEGPSSTMNSPSVIARSIRFSASKVANRLVTPSMIISAKLFPRRLFYRAQRQAARDIFVDGNPDDNDRRTDHHGA